MPTKQTQAEVAKTSRRSSGEEVTQDFPVDATDTKPGATASVLSDVDGLLEEMEEDKKWARYLNTTFFVGEVALSN